MTACPKPSPKPKRPRKPMKKRNATRKAKRFESDFGGEEYLTFIRSLPCDVCGRRGITVAAHLTSRGAGGKADVVAPLCHTHWAALGGPESFAKLKGCHERYDAHDPAIRKHETRLRNLAAIRWQSHLSSIPSLTENA